MRHHGYTAIPVISRKGQYVGTISEGDFLWNILPAGDEGSCVTRRDLEHLPIRDILRKDKTPPVRITASIEDLIEGAVQNNFIPVVDDLNSFIGIVTRKDIIRYLGEQQNCLLWKIV